MSVNSSIIVKCKLPTHFTMIITRVVFIWVLMQQVAVSMLV